MKAEEKRHKPLKQQNKIKIFRYICQHPEATKQSLTYHLNMSMPTVLQNIKELAEAGLVEEQGTLASTGGRRAKTISVVRNARYALGADITANHISLVLLDLSGSITAQTRIAKPYADETEYYQFFGTLVSSFIADHRVPAEKLLGIGVSLPGNIDVDHDLITQSHVLHVYQINLQKFRQFLPCDAIFCNDANAAGLAELNYIEDTAVLLSLGYTVGGAIFVHRQLYFGELYKGGEFGHMILIPDGKTCYCGKNGCVDAYCSSKVLSDLAEGSLPLFFERLEQQEEACTEAWDAYLRYLAIAVTNLRSAFDCPIILGGDVGGYLEPYLPRLKRLAARYNTFDPNSDYLSLCHSPKESFALGAGLQFIEAFYDTVI